MDERQLATKQGSRIVQSTIRFERGYSPLLPAREAASMSKDQKINDQDVLGLSNACTLSYKKSRRKNT